MPKYSRLAGKVFELLAMGALLGFTKNKKQRFELLREADHVWHTIDQKELQSLLRRFRIHKYIQTDNNKISLTNKGKSRWLSYIFKDIKLRRAERWDKKWRMVLFDIPELKKKIRDSLRRKLKEIGFFEFQKSVFVYPYPCGEEINFIINFFDISENVFYIEAPISPDDILRSHFKL